MKIISVRKGFTADHSSTSYEFLAIDKPLDHDAIEDVGSLSSRAFPTDRAVSFSYNVDGYDTPGGWWPLMEEYYDLMYSESYDWWMFAVAFPVTESQKDGLKSYTFDGLEDLGVNIEFAEDRIIVSFYCVLDYSETFAILDSGIDYGYYDDEYELEDYLNDDRLFRLLLDIRKQLTNEDYRVFDVFWHQYGEPLYSEEEVEELGLLYTNEFNYQLLPGNLQYLSSILRSI